MLGAYRLLRIEARRSTAALVMPVLVVGSLWLLWRQLDRGLLFWGEVSVVARDSVGLLGPAVGGVAAWVAGRERRHELADLLATTPLSLTRRRLATWAGVALWGVGAYLALVAAVLAVGASRTADGVPAWSLLLVGLAAVPAHAAVGYAVVSWKPGRFDAPVVAMILFMAQAVVGIVPGWVGLLSPVSELDVSPWFGPYPDVGGWQAAVLAGLMVAALATVGLRRAESGWNLAVLLAGVLVAGCGAAGIVHAAPEPAANNSLDNPLFLRWDGAPVRVAEPVCRAGEITVCVQPAFEPLLEDLAARLTALTEPVRGLPGVPVRFEQVFLVGSDPRAGAATVVPRPPAGTAAFRLDERAPDLGVDGAVFDAVGGLWPPVAAPGGDAPVREFTDVGFGWSPTGADARAAVEFALLTRAGVGIACADGLVSWGTGRTRFGYGQVDCGAVTRFAALPLAEQRAWLAADFDALLAGEVPLEDVPGTPEASP